LYFLDDAAANDPATLNHFLRETGTAFLVWDAQTPVPQPLRERASRRGAVPPGEDAYETLYRVLAFDPPAPAEAEAAP
jgi:hypothetical protein